MHGDTRGPVVCRQSDCFLLLPSVCSPPHPEYLLRCATAASARRERDSGVTSASLLLTPLIPGPWEAVVMLGS